MAQWWYRSMGSEVGPFSNADLLQKVRSGEVTPETEIKKDDAKWVLAKTVGGLFEAAGISGSQEKICPYCGLTLKKTPSKCPACKRWVGPEKKPKKQSKEKDISEKLRSQGEDYVEVESQADWLLMMFAISTGLLLISVIYCFISAKWNTQSFAFVGLFTFVSVVTIAIYTFKNRTTKN